MCLLTSARTVAIVFARSVGSEAMYCAGVLTFDGGFMGLSSFRTECITVGLKRTLRKLQRPIATGVQPAHGGVFALALPVPVDEVLIGTAVHDLRSDRE